MIGSIIHSLVLNLTVGTMRQCALKQRYFCACSKNSVNFSGSRSSVALEDIEMTSVKIKRGYRLAKHAFKKKQYDDGTFV